MDSLPPLPQLLDEILIEIFSKLPVKSLLRCRCVSKPWRSLISLSYKYLPPAMPGLFYKNYIANTIQFASLQSRTYTHISSISTNLSFLPPPLLHLNIADCCNGLLLLTTLHFDFLYVCNPATQKWAQIQQPPTQSTQLVLTFDPNQSKHYKILSVPFTFVAPVSDPRFEVFSSDTCEWTKIQWFVGRVYIGNKRFAFSNGILYFADAFVEDIFAIDIEEEVCRRIRLPVMPVPPPVPSLAIVQRCHGMCSGFLHYALITFDEMLVWFMEDPWSEEYVLRHRSSVQVIEDKMQGCWHLPDRMAFHPDLDVIFLLLGGKLFSYHLISTEVEEICNLEGGAGLFAYSPCYLEDLEL